MPLTTLFKAKAWFIVPALLGACSLCACTTNPVTGERELALISQTDEIAIGAAQYAPSRQMQGGDYLLDSDLTQYVRGIGQRLAAVSDRPLPYEFEIINSSVPNAWALPGGKIAVNRGLLVELSSEAELAAVLGHEIVHAAARHGAQAMQRGLLLQSAVLITGVAAQRGDYSGIVVGAASLGAQLINQRNSRGAELESDRFGMLYMSRAGYDPAAAVDLQRTFLRLSEGRAESGWFEGLFASHPPSAERVEKNTETLAELPAGGELGRERYLSATSRLRETLPAYEAHDDGRRALAEARYTAALELADRAIELLPDEAQFHGLRGDVALAQSQLQAAERDFVAAAARNDDYFYYPLRLGQTLVRLERFDEAELQFRASLERLPTADAHLGLGQVLERRGDMAGAVEHYRAAAGASSPAGRSAQQAMERIDLPRNPGAYLETRAGLDAVGQLIVEIANPTGSRVADVGVAIRYVDTSGQTVSVSRQVSGPIEPGTMQRFATGLGPFADSANVGVSLTSARVISQ